MDSDMSSAVSLALSILATASSSALWVFQFLERQPNLRSYWVSVNRFAGHLYPIDNGDDVQPLLLRVAVANHSASPDAVLEARFRVRSRAGIWLTSRPYLYLPACASDISRHVDKVTPLPVNVPPKQTVTLCRYLQIAVPRGTDFEAMVRDPLEVEVKLVSVSGRRFRSVIVKPEGLDEPSEATAEAML